MLSSKMAAICIKQIAIFPLIAETARDASFSCTDQRCEKTLKSALLWGV